MKKSQVSIFIIIVLILITGIILFFILNNKETNYQDFISNEKYNEIKNCLEKTSSDAIYFNFLQGGYYNVSEPKIQYYPIEIPVYYNKKVYFPEIKDIENHISLFVKENYNCSKEIEMVNVRILDKSIEFDYRIPLVIESGDNTVEYLDFENSFYSDFKEKYELVKSFLEYQKELEYEQNLTGFPLSHMTNLAYENDFIFEILEINKDIKIITIILNRIDERGELAYNFALDYNEN